MRRSKIRHYFWRPPFKQIPLLGLPGSTEFMEAYQAALVGERVPRLEIGSARAALK
jgi:hypothetical protein